MEFIRQFVLLLGAVIKYFRQNSKQRNLIVTVASFLLIMAGAASIYINIVGSLLNAPRGLGDFLSFVSAICMLILFCGFLSLTNFSFSSGFSTFELELQPIRKEREEIKDRLKHKKSELAPEIWTGG